MLGLGLWRKTKVIIYKLHLLVPPRSGVLRTQKLRSLNYVAWEWRRWCRDILGTNCDQCVSTVQCCFASTETIRLIRTGDGHLDFHTVPALVWWWWWWRWWWRAACLPMSVDILGTNCDQYVSTVQCSFTSTETIRLVRTGSPGRPPRLSHSSWTLLWFDNVSADNLLFFL